MSKNLKILLNQYETILDQIARRLKIERDESDERLYEQYHKRYVETKHQLEQERRYGKEIFL